MEEERGVCYNVSRARMWLRRRCEDVETLGSDRSDGGWGRGRVWRRSKGFPFLAVVSGHPLCPSASVFLSPPLPARYFLTCLLRLLLSFASSPYAPSCHPSCSSSYRASPSYVSSPSSLSSSWTMTSWTSCRRRWTSRPFNIQYWKAKEGEEKNTFPPSQEEGKKGVESLSPLSLSSFEELVFTSWRRRIHWTRRECASVYVGPGSGDYLGRVSCDLGL